MRAPDPNKQKGELILYIGPMNSGKTETLVKHALNLQEHAGQKLIGFSIDTNTRDGLDQIIGENGDRIPARTIKRDEPRRILEYIELEDKEKYVDIVVFDEVNLYNHELIPVINQLRREERLIMAAGLDKSFRGESFGIIPALKELVNPHLLSDINFNSYCKMLNGGRQCGNLTRYTVRLRKDSNDKKQFYDKDGKIITGFGYAPYFDPLVLIESKELSGTIAYTTACEDCFKIPYKDETLQAYKELSAGKHPREIKISRLDEIIHMLESEHKIRKIGGGLYTPHEYYFDMETGIAIPKKYKNLELEITNSEFNIKN